MGTQRLPSLSLLGHLGFLVIYIYKQQSLYLYSPCNGKVPRDEDDPDSERWLRCLLCRLLGYPIVF